MIRAKSQVYLLLVSIIISSSIAGCFEGSDIDDDGLLDDSDNCKFIPNPNQIDFDLDGIGDICDEDIDGDGILNQNDKFPLNKNESHDSDSDGIGDNEDIFPNNDKETHDSDGDGIGDNGDKFPQDVSEWLDTDKDGVGNNLDLDDDGDGYPDSIDQFDMTPVSNLSISGPFNVGTMDLKFLSSRGNELTIQIWYPTQDSSGEEVVFDSTYGGTSFDDATPDCSEPRPVSIYSHGFPSIRWGSSFLMANLASHGYIIVAPDHPYMTIWDIDIDFFQDSILSMPYDVMDSFNWLEEQNNKSTIFQNCIVPEAGYSVIGQSTGGYNSMLLAGAEVLYPDLEKRCMDNDEIACRIKENWDSTNPEENIAIPDSRVWGVVLLSPWNASILDSGISNVNRPVMILSGDADDTTTINEVNNTAYRLGENLIHYAILNNSGHYAFAPVGCEAYGCSNLLDIEYSTSFANQAVTIFLANLQNWPNSNNYAMPMGEFINWQ